MNLPVLKFISTPRGLVLRSPYVPNPKNVDYGVIALIQNGKITKKLASFNEHNKESLIRHYNLAVTKRKDRENKYEVRVLYGMFTYEYISNNFEREEKAESKNQDSDEDIQERYAG